MPKSRNRIYSKEVREEIEAHLLQGSSARELGAEDWERIETSAAVYLSLLRNKPQPKELRNSLKRLRKSAEALESGLENALPALELSAQQAEAFGGLSRLISDLEKDLSSLRALIDAADNKIPKGKGRKKEPSMATGPDIIGEMNFNVGSPLQWFVRELADIWEKHNGLWPKRSSNPYADSAGGERSDYYPEGWEGFVRACIAPLEKSADNGIVGIHEAMRQVGRMGKN